MLLTGVDAMTNSIEAPTRRKPDKPYPDYPLFPHGSGQWARKIQGKLHYFGVWKDPEAALKKHNAQWPYLSNGESPPADLGAGCTVRELANRFLSFKES